MLLGSRGSEHNDRHILEFWVFANLFESLNAIKEWHNNIQQDKADILPLQYLYSLNTVITGYHAARQFLLKDHLCHLQVDLIIIND